MHNATGVLWMTKHIFQVVAEVLCLCIDSSSLILFNPSSFCLESVGV